MRLFGLVFLCAFSSHQEIFLVSIASATGTFLSAEGSTQQDSEATVQVSDITSKSSSSIGSDATIVPSDPVTIISSNASSSSSTDESTSTSSSSKSPSASSGMSSSNGDSVNLPSTGNSKSSDSSSGSELEPPTTSSTPSSDSSSGESASTGTTPSPGGNGVDSSSGGGSTTEPPTTPSVAPPTTPSVTPSTAPPATSPAPSTPTPKRDDSKDVKTSAPPPPKDNGSKDDEKDSDKEDPTGVDSGNSDGDQADDVEEWTSTTLPPGYDDNDLDGSELVNVKAVKKTTSDGKVVINYTIVIRKGDKYHTINYVDEDGEDSASFIATSSDPSDAFSSPGRLETATDPSGGLGNGAIFGIVGAAVVVCLIVAAFLIRRRRRNKMDDDDDYNDTMITFNTHSNGTQRDTPGTNPYRTCQSQDIRYNKIGRGMSLEDGHVSMHGTWYDEVLPTARNSGSNGTGKKRARTLTSSYNTLDASSNPRNSLWEDPVIVAARIPFENVQVGRLVSRGGFGEVFLGSYRGQDVAIKQLLPDNRKDLRCIEGFLSEIKLQITLEHPQIVTFKGVAWESLSEIMSVSEYMGGGDLRSLLIRYGDEGQPLGFSSRKLQIALHISMALTYLHSLQPIVLHRDLKSRNVLLSTELDAKLTDFGASRIHEETVTLTAGVGSSLWMAPQVMLGRPYDEKSDIYSFGVVLYEIASHELPYAGLRDSTGRGLTEAAMLQLISTGQVRVEVPNEVPTKMKQLIEACVAFEEEKRPTAAQVLYELQKAARE